MNLFYRFAVCIACSLSLSSVVTFARGERNYLSQLILAAILDVLSCPAGLQ